MNADKHRVECTRKIRQTHMSGAGYERASTEKTRATGTRPHRTGAPGDPPHTLQGTSDSCRWPIQHSASTRNGAAGTNPAAKTRSGGKCGETTDRATSPPPRRVADSACLSKRKACGFRGSVQMAKSAPKIQSEKREVTNGRKRSKTVWAGCGSRTVAVIWLGRGRWAGRSDLDTPLLTDVGWVVQVADRYCTNSGNKPCDAQ